MGAPQIIIIVLYTLSLWINLDKYTQDKQSGSSFAGSVAAIALQVGLLAWGGFFS